MPNITSIVFPETAVSNPGFDRYLPIITVKDLKDRYLHGVDFRDNEGKTIKNSVFQFWIDQAISFVEHEIEQTIVPTNYQNEEYDYRYEEYQSWGLIQLRHKPIITDPVIQMRLNKTVTFTTIPNDWVRCEKHTGQVQIVPTTGSLGEFNFGNLSYLPRVLLFNSDWPAFFRISYTAGYEQDKLPAIIAQLIGLLAALQALNVAGDLVLGAGIAATAISMDGLSQSISSTASATHTAYGARIDQYQADVQRILDLIRRYYGKKVKIAIC